MELDVAGVLEGFAVLRKTAVATLAKPVVVTGAVQKIKSAKMDGVKEQIQGS